MAEMLYCERSAIKPERRSGARAEVRIALRCNNGYHVETTVCAPLWQPNQAHRLQVWSRCLVVNRLQCTLAKVVRHRKTGL